MVRYYRLTLMRLLSSLSLFMKTSNQRDIEYSDNLPWGTGASVRIHIFTKAVAGFPTTYALGRIIADLFRADYWNCGTNTELSENDNIKHRVMDFSREFYSR